MNVGLGWLGVVVGAVGCVVTYAMAGGTARSSDEPDAARERRTAIVCAGATLVVTLIAWAVGMRTRVPFSPGQGLAFGLLIGGVTGATAILLSFRLSHIASSVRAERLASLSSLFLGLFAVSLAYSLFHTDPWESLIGFCFGAVMAAIFHTYMQYVTGGELSVRTETWAVFSITVAAAILLSMRHFDAVQHRMWWALPILLATSVLIADYVAIEIASIGTLRDDPGKSYLVSVLIGAALVVGLTAIYSWKLYDDWALLGVSTAGIGIGALIAWIFAAFKREGNTAGAIEAGAATVLLVAAFAVVAFKLWSGLGIAIGLIAASVVAIPAWIAPRTADERQRLLADAAVGPLAVGLAIVLFRLFVEQYRPGLRGSDLEFHYTFIGGLLGAILPFVLLASVVRLREARAGSGSIVAVAVLGLVAAASGLVLSLLWGERCGLGFSFGLIAAMAFMLLARLAYGDVRYSIAPLVIAAELAAIQFTAMITELEATRAVRIGVLAAAALLFIVWFGLTNAYAARRAQ